MIESEAQNQNLKKFKAIASFNKTIYTLYSICPLLEFKKKKNFKHIKFIFIEIARIK